MTRRVFSAMIALAIVLAAGCAPEMSAVEPSPFPRAPQPAQTAAASRISPRVAADVVGTALGLRGVPYRLGGDDPAAGMDCSGFVRYVFAEHAVDLPRTVAEQVRTGRRVSSHDAEPGDLVFFDTGGAGPSHVGIALGPTTFVHAPGAGHVIRVESFDTPYWSPRLIAVRRVIPKEN